MRWWLAALAAAAVATTAAAPASPAGATGARGKVGLRLGYLANLTHAADIVGISGHYFSRALGSGVNLSTNAFNAGPDVVTALLAGQLDAAYLGPNPAISAFLTSHGNFQIVAGAASGGAALVVQRSIKSARQLKGTRLSSPQLGNTQDVSLRIWLASKGLHTAVSGSGDVRITPQANSQIVTAFQAKAITGAWVPEPYVATLVAAGGHVLVNEASLWPRGRFSTTVLVVNKGFLKAHPTVVRGLILGELNAIQHINANKVAAEAEINAAVKTLTGKTLKTAILHVALADLAITWDPIASSVTKDAVSAASLHFLPSSNIKGIFNVVPLNALLRSKHLAQVVAP